MDGFYFQIGRFACYVGGALFLIGVLSILGWIVCEAWIAVSDRFRDICKAESLIFEYRKNRSEFMVWKNAKDGDGSAKTE